MRPRKKERERERASTVERGETHVGTKKEVKKFAAYHHRGVTVVTRQTKERETERERERDLENRERESLRKERKRERERLSS